MKTYQGTGTMLYGKKNIDSDGSYIATKWFTFFLIPVIPLTTYRVWEGKTDAKFSPFHSSTQYRLTEIPFDWRQALKTFLIWWSCLAILVYAYLS